MVFALRGFAGKPGTTFFRQFHCRKHCFRRTRLYCSNCGENVDAERITGLICGRKLGGCVSFAVFLSSVPQGHFLRRCFAPPSERSTQRRGDKRSAEADLLASNALLRGGRHKARPVSSKTLPRGSNGGRSPLGLSFSPIFLQTKKDGATGGRSEKRMPVKT